jgi:single-strand DNA-binding protein
MRGLNKVTLIGNLGKDPELQTLDGGISVVKFPLATTEYFKDRNGQPQSETEWHTIVLWRNLADLAAKILRKGSLIYIEGKIKTRSFEDRNGERKTMTEIIGDSFIMLDKNENTSALRDASEA